MKTLSADEAASAAAEEKFGKGALPESQIGAEGGLTPKAPGKPMTKSDDDDTDDTDDDTDDTDDTDKSLNLSRDDLMKAMDTLEAVSEGIGGEPDRRAELGEKVALGTISKSERAELFELLGAPEAPEADDDQIAKSFTNVFLADDQLAQDYEVAPFIERHSQLVAESLDSMRESLAKSMGDQQMFNRALAKSFRGIGGVITEQGDMIKSLSVQNTALAERLGIVEKKPNLRKARTSSAQPLRKSFAGGEPAAGGLSEQQINDGLGRLMVKSRDNNFLAPCGEPIDRAVALYESSRKITRRMLGDVATEMGVQLEL